MRKQSLCGVLVLCSAPLWMGADGCDPVFPRDCKVDGKTYAPGQRYESDCNTCTCERDGTSSCTLVACAEDDEEDTCLMGDVEHVVGERWQVDCNVCTCEAGGDWSCSLVDCDGGLTCEYDGETYLSGETFPLDDACNYCSCGADGEVTCTDTPCDDPYPDCRFGESSFVEGDEVICPDGCNACACTQNGDGTLGWASTDAACQPRPQLELCGENPENVAVDALYLEANALAVRVSPHDGCSPRDFRLCWNGAVAESDPAQVWLWVEHIWNGAQCDDQYEEDLVFDISSLPVSSGSTLRLHIGDAEVLYTR